MPGHDQGMEYEDFDENPMDYRELNELEDTASKEIDVSKLSNEARHQLAEDALQTRRVTDLIKDGQSEFYRYPYPPQDISRLRKEVGSNPKLQKKVIERRMEIMKQEAPGDMVKNVLSHMTETDYDD